MESETFQMLATQQTLPPYMILFNVTDMPKPSPISNNLLLDCGATSHIVNDPTKFISFNSSFDPTKHFVEVADGCRSNQNVTHKGNAKLQVQNFA